ncbi:MAG TPA: hypothetical protein VMZ27_18245 [Candidatus Saccharimonadales bacterium]|nr:hypothetical protein [Candidatus Saccharimonadales bacterium]
MNEDQNPKPPPYSQTAPLESFPGESLEAYEFFQCFINIGPKRTLRMVAEILDMNINSVKQWSWKNHWFSRLQTHKNNLARLRAQTEAATVQQNAANKVNAEDARAEKDEKFADMCLEGSQKALAIKLEEPEELTVKEAVEIGKFGLGHRRPRVQSTIDPGLAEFIKNAKFVADRIYAEKESKPVTPDQAPSELPPAPDNPTIS